MKRTEQSPEQPTPVTDDANATATQLQQRADVDYKAAAPARHDLTTQLRR
ncbi:hypothetical protein [Streptomyces lunaelactis]|nr:hypothetical protein [Streptomyces lunaelactis]NUK22051.1 hypothetical protein [Streptomyces lunaelactis]